MSDLKKKSPKKVEETKIDKPNKVNDEEKVIVLPIDASTEDVLNYDKQGFEIIYNDDFPVLLKSNQAAQLSMKGRERYFIQKAVWAVKEGEKKSQFTPMERKTGSSYMPMGRASDRLKVRNKDPKMHYSYQYPHDVEALRRNGYVIATGVETGADKRGGAHVISEKGQDEMVLMMRPKDEHLKMLDEVGSRSRKRVTAVDDDVRTEMDKALKKNGVDGVSTIKYE